MTRATGLALGRAIFGLLGLVAMGYQLADLAGKGTLDVVNYFSYFTIDSNLLAAAILLIGALVHELMPLVVVADWLLDPPATRLMLRQGLLWLSFPIVWLAYTMIRGAVVGHYPYPFLDPANGGYATAVAYCAAVLVVMAVVSALAVVLGRAAHSAARIA